MKSNLTHRAFGHVLVSLIALSQLAGAAEQPTALSRADMFGALPSVLSMSLSPDGKRVAYVGPIKTGETAVFVREIDAANRAKPILASAGPAERIEYCGWVSDSRLACLAETAVKDSDVSPISSGTTDFAHRYTRWYAVNAGGGQLVTLSNENNFNTRGVILGGGDVLDWLPEAENSVLMQRIYVPDDQTGSPFGSTAHGYGVDLVDTITKSSKVVLAARDDGCCFVTDGHGNVRVRGLATYDGDHKNRKVSIQYFYRAAANSDWQELGKYDATNQEGFRPAAVDFDKNVIYGYRKLDGRLAVYTHAMDGSNREELVLARPDVDMGDLLRIGRRERVVGALYGMDRRRAEYFDPALKNIVRSITKALPPDTTVGVVDSSMDENVLLLHASRDDDPGVYYVFNKTTRHMQTFLVSSDVLDGVILAKVQPIEYPAADGTMIPGYLTLPPGVRDARGLPAIVMPQGGPSSRDVWGFDFLSQFFAARGFAVLQPNYRGSAGYGDEWQKKNGFRSWRTSIGDILDAGRWLTGKEMVDPKKLAIVGWSYGGYAALQSAVVGPDVFKAAVAIAPVTDLPALEDNLGVRLDWNLVQGQYGSGHDIVEASPARNAGKIKVPVLLIHGTVDDQVPYRQSQTMDKALTDAHVSHKFITLEGMDHSVENSAERGRLLRESDEFLRQTLGIDGAAAPK